MVILDIKQVEIAGAIIVMGAAGAQIVQEEGKRVQNIIMMALMFMTVTLAKAEVHVVSAKEVEKGIKYMRCTIKRA